jgi:hypothetical protein
MPKELLGASRMAFSVTIFLAFSRMIFQIAGNEGYRGREGGE